MMSSRVQISCISVVTVMLMHVGCGTMKCGSTTALVMAVGFLYIMYNYVHECTNTCMHSAHQEQALAYTRPAVAAPLETRRTQEPTRTELDEDDHLEKLLQMTEKKAAPHWRAIGRELGFTSPDIQMIIKTAFYSDRHYYSLMIKKWLNWAPPNHDDIATLEALIAAMRTIDELGRLARKLEKNRTSFT